MKIPLLADRTGAIAKQYGVYKEDDGMSFRFVCQQGQFFLVLFGIGVVNLVEVYL